MKQRIFTDSYIRALKPSTKPYKRSEYAPKGEGRLIVRVLPASAGSGGDCIKEFFYRYRVRGLDKTLKLGRYGQGRTLSDIRAACRERRTIQHETGDVKEHLRAKARRADAERRKGTLGQLLNAYVGALRAAGKPSTRQAQGCFRRNVFTPFAALAATRANQIEPGDIQLVLARMVKAGIKRQVNVTRSYLRAAFQWGAEADHDPRTAANDGVLFAIKSNPVALVPVIEEFECEGNRTLTENELRVYWNGLEALPLAQRATLRFHLALGAQRPTQLLRAGWPAFDFHENTLLLRDIKGRGGWRDHLLPLTPFALAQLKSLRDMNAAAPLPFTTDGKRPMALETLSVAVAEISKALEKSQQISKFQLRDIRRTVETILQKLGIEKEVRAHLLSHGRSQGVQGKHYERYHFLPEKRRALERWAAYLEQIISGGDATNVIAIRAA